MKIVSSCYLDSSSRGTFTYCKARLIRNELLEKEVGSSEFCCLCCRAPDCCVSLAVELLSQFIEKRREMKQEGRTEQELSESFCFLYPDKSKVLLKTARSMRCSFVLPDSKVLSLWRLQLQWICEKGLAVGHSRITTLGNPSVGELKPARRVCCQRRLNCWTFAGRMESNHEVVLLCFCFCRCLPL